MNKKILYIAIGTLAGLLLGYLIFSSGRMEENGTATEVVQGDHSHTGTDLWTCSMHPQILQPEPGDCPLCGMDLIPAGIGDSQHASNQIRMTENAMLLADIRTIRVGEGTGTMDGVLSLSGRIVENEEANRVQASYFDGRIERLFVTHEGQQIREGQQLATLYAPNLVAAQQELLTAAPLKETQPGLYAAVRTKLKNWKLTDQQIDQIEASGSVTEHFPIYANVSGTVTALLASEGDYIKIGQPIARLSNLATVWADFDAYERQLKEFSTGQEIVISTNAYPDKEFNARISFIDPLLDASTRTVTLRATLENTGGMLKPGMFVSGRIKVKASGQDTPLMVPASAVMWTGERSLVYVKDRPDEPVFSMREIVLGTQSGDNIVVTSGLEPGEEIVVNGTFTVDAAAQLQGKKSMMNKGGQEAPRTYNDLEGQEFISKLGSVLNLYIELKDALVDSDPVTAGRKAAEMAEVLPGMDMAIHLGHKEALQGMRKDLNALAEGASLEEQRFHFRLISENLISMARPLGSSDQPIYLQYCPMANQNRGAYWLSLESDVKNPYYGEAMLKCGEVRATWSGVR